MLFIKIILIDILNFSPGIHWVLNNNLFILLNAT